MGKKLTIDKRIKQIVDSNWIVPIYFLAGIKLLYEKSKSMSDEELRSLFGGLVHPTVAKGHIEEIYERLKD